MKIILLILITLLVTIINIAIVPEPTWQHYAIYFVGVFQALLVQVVVS